MYGGNGIRPTRLSNAVAGSSLETSTVCRPSSVTLDDSHRDLRGVGEMQKRLLPRGAEVAEEDFPSPWRVGRGRALPLGRQWICGA